MDIYKLTLLIWVLASGLVKGQDVTQFNYGLEKFQLPTDGTNPLLAKVPQGLYLNKGHLYIFPEGTGRIYVNDSISGQPIRLDSTKYYGFTFGSHIFFYRDTLYSFGGYGYWNTNGHLRVFINQKGEWELEPLNREVPFSKGNLLPVVWLNEEKGKLWIGYSINRKEGIKGNGKNVEAVNDSVYVLDMVSKNFSVAGASSASQKGVFHSTTTKNLAASPWGQLVFDSNQNSITLLDFENNELALLNNAKAKAIFRTLQIDGLVHFKDSNLVIQSHRDWIAGNFSSGDSIQLSRADFSSTGNRIFEPTLTPILGNTNSTAYLHILLSFATGGMVVGLLLYMVSIRPARTKEEVREKQILAFDDKEKEVINLVVSNSMNGIGTTVEQINQLLGVTNKSIEIQKKQRSDVFLSINEKWSRIGTGVLIDKRRLDQDKRSYEYLIANEKLHKVNSIVRS
ncbi:MAG: hypothetical protein UZ12_BCD005002387 [Bacteroidetes bacterium OLB12]|nr:MAG: hypothetical protein UZ12_BCD005002387 [Bacteroidetes bacterium OLB12]HNU42098.1 hypothetical protein [Cyclobacteriaceae bacterium]